MTEDLLAGLHVPQDPDAGRVSARRNELAIGPTVVVDVRTRAQPQLACQGKKNVSKGLSKKERCQQNC